MRVITFDKHFDERGELYTSWDDRICNVKFVQDRVSQSKFNTIRGFHGDGITWKLISCLHGTLKLVTYDLHTRDRNEFILSSKDKKLNTVLVPPNVLNGHQCLSDICVLHYKWSEYYSGPENQISIYYNDPAINPNWEYFHQAQIVSPRDQQAPSLQTFLDGKTC